MPIVFDFSPFWNVQASMVNLSNPSSLSVFGATIALHARFLKSTDPPTIPPAAKPTDFPLWDVCEVKSTLVSLDSFSGSALSPRCHTPT